MFDPSHSKIKQSLKYNYHSVNTKPENKVKTSISNKLDQLITDKADLSKNSGNSLILLTEAPTTNIIRWSSITLAK